MKNKINKELSKMLSFICKNPLIYTNESDLHSLFFLALNNIPEYKYDELYDTSCSIGLNNQKKVSDKKYKTMLVHREYGHCNLRNARSDLVIFNKKNIKEISDPINLKKGSSATDYIQSDYIFEFGTEKVTNFETHISSDIKKIKNAKELGYIIHIHKNFTKTKSDSNDKKFDKYLDILNNLKKPENTKIIFIKIDIGTETKKLNSKVKIFMNNKLEEINLNNIEKTISENLK